MASTPSASALSAVLRCRGNIWARNPPTKRPAPSAYGRGLPGRAVRDSPAERARSDGASPWEAFLLGERVVVGRRADGKVLREKGPRDINKLCHPKLSQSAGDARAAVPAVQSALVRQLARRLTSNLPGLDKRSQTIPNKTYDPRLCKIVFVKETSVLKLSITSPRLMEHSGQIRSFLLTGWSSLKSTCLSLTALVSEFMCSKLAVLCRSRCNPDDAPRDERGSQANGQIHSPTDLISSTDSCQDRPD